MRVRAFRRVRAVPAVRAAVLLAGAAALALIACVDGTTPDCSDAASGCGPDVDGAIADAPADVGEGGAIDAPAEATDAPIVDAPIVDAPVDAKADAGDAKAG
jgi:hypothetical protein